MTTTSIVFMIALLLTGLGTMTMVVGDATGSQNARYVGTVVVLAVIFGWILGLVSGS